MPPHKAVKVEIYHGRLDLKPPAAIFQAASIKAFQFPIIKIGLDSAARTISGNFRPFAIGPLK